MSHTPGPWEAYHVQSAGWSVRMQKPREGYDRPDPICSMAWWQFDKPGIIDNDISGANAKLIAAAPELLERLQALVALAETDDEANDPSTDLYVELYAARFAIAAATLSESNE